MRQIKAALEDTSSHGLPRVVSKKPIYVRVAWLLIFLLMMSLFIKGLVDFFTKLQSRPVTTSLHANKLWFQLPDMYACFENPIAASYSTSLDSEAVDAINAGLNYSIKLVNAFSKLFNNTEAQTRSIRAYMSVLFPQSLPYNQLVRTIAHRVEQAAIESHAAYKDGRGLPMSTAIEVESFYDPSFLRCLKWSINSTLQKKMLMSKTSSGLVATLLIDTNWPLPGSETTFPNGVNLSGSTIGISDWPLSTMDLLNIDRRAGVRIFLAPHGEYPSEFVTSFSLAPGKHHTVEIGMTQQVYQEGQFDCWADSPSVQFVNPYDQTPYNHTYSYSYCYYYEYHRLYQSLLNVSGDVSPMPWPLRGITYALNISSYLRLATEDQSVIEKLNSIEQQAQDLCESKRPCSTLDYSVSISSADWPTQSSLAPFVSSSIAKAWTSAKAKNLSVPALDFLLTSSNASNVASYVRSNLLKVHFKPRKVLCDLVTFSKDYGLANFISDVGGIMGIYLGMSLLTLCELLELTYDLLMILKTKQKTVPSPMDSFHIGGGNA